MRKPFTIHNIHKLIGYHLRILIPPDDEIRMFGVWDVYIEEESYHIKLGENRIEVDNRIDDFFGDTKKVDTHVRVRLQMVGFRTQYGSVEFEDMKSIDGFISALAEVRWSSYPLITSSPA
jgi:hypothetical protein